MDAELRDVIRADDPMAAYALKQQAKAAAAAGKPAKPVYKGPAPKPNRYSRSLYAIQVHCSVHNQRAVQLLIQCRERA
jgi:Pre-mRNA-splicing factor of RES complex